MHLLPKGFDEEETHHLFPVLKPFKEVKKPEALLLPYCAKELECAYRNLQGCEECGQCSVGEAVQMARSFGMDPITIQNYEELESTLSSLKHSGARDLLAHAASPFMENTAQTLKGSVFPESSSMWREAPATISDKKKRHSKVALRIKLISISRFSKRSSNTLMVETLQRKSYDIVVIGAGPAGSSAARAAAKGEPMYC